MLNLISVFLTALTLSFTWTGKSSLAPVVDAFSVGSPFFQSLSYSPNYRLLPDSIIIPLKHAGRLLLVNARVDGEVGNLVFDTGANKSCPIVLKFERINSGRIHTLNIRSVT